MTEERFEFFPRITDVTDRNRAGDGDISARPLEEIESLCMQCRKQGVTRMMLTSIPSFQEVIVMSFCCQHCGHSKNEIQSAGKIRLEGVMYTVKVLNRGDLDRQLICSETCTSINIPEFQLVLPPPRGQFTTVEGLLRKTVADISVQHPHIRDKNAYAKIQDIVDGLKQIIADGEDGDEGKDTHEQRELSNEDPVTHAITITLDDPSGNSLLEFVGSMSDLKWNMHTYERSLEQNQQLGLVPSAEDSEENTADKGRQESEGLNEELFEFPGICPHCGRPLITRMKKVFFPYFKDSLIMSTNCDDCGYRDNESILDQVYDELTEKVFNTGDFGVIDIDDRAEFREFLRKLEQVKNAEISFTLILDDPLANSHPNMEIISYERTWQQNEDLGLNDTNVESYDGDDMKGAES
ncbi:zf-ZPR1-domain-containing protein [Suillus hirtellus]|nr:zf-ZPR1-domain-containing protein [Suillus hirtellus]